MDDFGFKFAFTIENYIDKTVRDDPAYVKYLARYVISTNGIITETLLSFHKCNDTDWKDFAPTGKAFVEKFENIKKDPNRYFNCIDWPDNEPPVIYGT